MSERNEESFRNYVSSELRKGEDRMDTICLSMAAIELEQLQSRVLLANNTATTNRVEASVERMGDSIKDMLAVFVSWQGAMNVIEMVGKVAKPVGFIALMVSSILGVWVAIKTGIGLK